MIVNFNFQIDLSKYSKKTELRNITSFRKFPKPTHLRYFHWNEDPWLILQNSRVGIINSILSSIIAFSLGQPDRQPSVWLFGLRPSPGLRLHDPMGSVASNPLNPARVCHEIYIKGWHGHKHPDALPQKFCCEIYGCHVDSHNHSLSIQIWKPSK